MKFGMIVPQVNVHQLMESDFQFDVTFSRWTLSIFPAPTQCTRQFLPFVLLQ